MRQGDKVRILPIEYIEKHYLAENNAVRLNGEFVHWIDFIRTIAGQDGIVVSVFTRDNNRYVNVYINKAQCNIKIPEAFLEIQPCCRCMLDTNVWDAVYCQNCGRKV
ncbi:MAG: hypothetical protein ACRDD8_06210 [Bacteroidales bacterium]